MEPPRARKEPKSFEIHGYTLHDNYAWMRDKTSEDLLTYLKAENEYKEQMLKHTEPLQENLYNEMVAYIKEDDQSPPYQHGKFRYYRRTEKGKNYFIYCREVEGSERVLLDVNQLAEGKDFCNVAGVKPDTTHKILSYAVDYDGYENYDIKFFDIESGKYLENEIQKVSANFNWGIANTVYYHELDDIHRSHTLVKYDLDTGEKTELMREDDKSFFLYSYRSLDGKYLLIFANGPDTQTAYFMDFKTETIKAFQERREDEIVRIDHKDGFIYALTNRDAKNYKLVRAPVGDVDAWEELMPESKDLYLNSVFCMEKGIVLSVRENGFSTLKIFSDKTKELRSIKLPEKIFTVSHAENYEYSSQSYRFQYTSSITPRTWYDLDLDTLKLTMVKQEEINNYSPDDYRTDLYWATSHDGTKVPISIAYKKGLFENGPAPIYMKGYGSYGASYDPRFSAMLLPLLARGVALATAHIRGGGELGRYWYDMGKMEHKMNTFRDFIACADYLVENNYTTRDQLAVMGRSAGGLLMGATLNMRPNLCKAFVAGVPFVDVINTMLDDSIPLTTFEYKEWGNPNIKEQFEWMYEYSPYDNVEAKEYPAMFVTGGLNDPRVHIWEPAKWVARLREMRTDSNFFVFHVNMGAGHMGSSGRYSYMREMAIEYAFVLDQIS